jgi:hypothetical protein
VVVNALNVPVKWSNKKQVITCSWLANEKQRMACEKLFAIMWEENFHFVAEVYTHKPHHRTPRKHYFLVDTLQ